ncbi:C-_U-editing enzyme APOBEC-1-like [Tiliqua scincoides]|uniref:C->U-editing enzyme APOBEC-1-like n=1 Tax=Tiliqua scincoides TaxID=71010 RepID=UPI003461A003
MAQGGQFDRSTSQGWTIEPEAFMSNFAEDSHPRETDLLYEIQWEGGSKTWKNFCRNEHPIHAEIIFLENEWSELMTRRRHKTTPCSITWFLSWSPCGECSSEIVDFLEEHPYVTLEIRVARLYRYDDERNRQGLRNLDQSGVEITIMNGDDYSYCWRTFVAQEESDEDDQLKHFFKHVYSKKLYRSYSKKLKRILESS